MTKTDIPWCDNSINPGIFGCSPKSTECEHCYAAKMAHRQVAMGNYPTGITEKIDGVRWTGKVVLGDGGYMYKQFSKLPHTKPVRVFMTSMADLFHKKVDFGFITSVYMSMSCFPNCTFFVLTKWPERLLSFQKYWQAANCKIPYLKNVVHGITAGTQETFNERWPILRQIESAAYFVSMEPLLSKIILPQDLLGLGKRMQLIWGGENGPRPMHLSWSRGIRDQGLGNVKLFFKSWGSFLPQSQMIPGVHLGIGERAGPDDSFIKTSVYGKSDLLDGVQYHEYPVLVGGHRR